MKPPVAISLQEARRFALAAQGFDRPRPTRVTAAALTRTIRALGLLQLDFVNVVCPSHRIVMYSRLGAFPPRLLHAVLYRSCQFTEQWAHEASCVPVDAWPLLRERRETHRARPWGFDDIVRRHKVYFDTVLQEIDARGSSCAADMPDPTHTGRRLPESWYGSVPRAVLEACFGRGHLAVVDRRDDHARVFDRAERVVPEPHFSRRVDAQEAERQLLLIAARAHGVGTAADFADYFRMPVAAARPRLAELVDAGGLKAVRVEGWMESAFLAAGAACPARLNAQALLSPFDPVIWFRPRTRRLFDFDYRFEIFIPEAKRRWGTYVLPFLLGDRLVARVDLKADRPEGTLRVPGAYLEDGQRAADVAPALAAELRSMAAWLGLRRVRVGRRGNLARILRQMLAAD